MRHRSPCTSFGLTPSVMCFAANPIVLQPSASPSLILSWLVSTPQFSPLGRRCACLRVDQGSTRAFTHLEHPTSQGAGKSYTMFEFGDNSKDERRGLAPRMLECLFARTHGSSFRCAASHVESEPIELEPARRCSRSLRQYDSRLRFCAVYNEVLTDLLAPDSDKPLRLREDSSRGVHVANITTVALASTEQALRTLATGLSNRTVGHTAMNRKSSRSHAVFTLHIEEEICAAEGSEDAAAAAAVVVRRSQLHLVDLAGSERYTDACSSNARRKEAHVARSRIASASMRTGPDRLALQCTGGKIRLRGRLHRRATSTGASRPSAT